MKRTVHTEAKWIFPFVAYSSEEKTGKKPLIVQLHGAGERGDGTDVEKVEVHGFANCLKDVERDCVVVMPQCPAITFWAARVESIVRFIEQVIQEYDIDKDRVYLTGLSMGGFGTWYTAMARPDLFAAIAPVCGGGMAWNAGVLNMPIWAFHGAEDSVVNPRHSDEMVEALKAQGKEVAYTRLDGVGHNAWTYAYNETLLDWLLGKKRQ